MDKDRITELASYPEQNPHPVVEWNQDLELKFANDAAKEILDNSAKSDKKPENCIQSELPQIEEELRSQPKYQASVGGEGEVQTLYREFNCSLRDEDRVFGFHFHYIPNSRSIRGYGFDVTDRNRAEKNLHIVNKDLELLIKTNKLIIRTDNQSELMDQVCNTIVDIHSYPLVWIGRKEDEKKRVVPVAHSGSEEGYLDNLDVRWSENRYGENPTGRAIRKNKPQVDNHIQAGEDDSYHLWRKDAEEQGFSSIIALPIPGEDEVEVYGTLNVYCSRIEAFPDQRIELLQQLAEDLGQGLQFLKARNELEEMTIGTLEALSQTVEAKDKYTSEHIDRVRKYALEVGEAMGLSEGELEQLSYASELHDIGKVRIPNSILGKPGELTEEEWKKMKEHPTIGAEIVGKVPRLKQASKIVAQHQEKYDGSGYPAGLKGNEITLEARIIAVVDAWDAMRTDRPYRDALPRDEAIQELEDNAGTQFDPEIVDVLLDLINEKGGK